MASTARSCCSAESCAKAGWPRNRATTAATLAAVSVLADAAVAQAPRAAAVAADISDRYVFCMFEPVCPPSSRGLATLRGHQCDDGLVVPAVRMCVWPASRDRFISAGIWDKGMWTYTLNERTRRRIVCNLASSTRDRAAWIYDVGANIGSVTLPLAALGRNVLAFEAYPPNAALLNASLIALTHRTAAGGYSRLIHAALTAPGAPTVLCMREPDPSNQGSVLVSRTAAACDDRARVRALTMDAALAEVFPTALLSQSPLPRVSALKIDVEGHEVAVLSGAGQLFNASPPRALVIEARRKSARWVKTFASTRGYLPTWEHTDDYAFARREISPLL